MHEAECPCGRCFLSVWTGSLSCQSPGGLNKLSHQYHRDQRPVQRDDERRSAGVVNGQHSATAGQS
ncbi:hypothetical protein NXC14_CH02523 [Rhizobium sp. NXC14]|nr:hypothetical protein NXC14_CH02523 [Rhizobium sp. NXC14]